MNKQCNSRLMLIFPFTSSIIVFIHFWIIQRFIDYNNNSLIPKYLLLNRSTIISILGHIFMMICGFVLYGSIRDKDFRNNKLIITIYCFGFLILMSFTFIGLYSSIKYFSYN